MASGGSGEAFCALQLPHYLSLHEPVPGLLLSAESPSWKASRAERQPVSAGWLGKVLGTHYVLNSYSSYSCDSASAVRIFLCPQGWVADSGLKRAPCQPSWAPNFPPHLCFFPEDTEELLPGISFISKQKTSSHCSFSPYISLHLWRAGRKTVTKAHLHTVCISCSYTHPGHIYPAPWCLQLSAVGSDSEKRSLKLWHCSVPGEEECENRHSGSCGKGSKAEPQS